jgi:Co/Zn/Cd efflux system component
MKKTTFKIMKMDCSSEEQIIRMKLDGLTNIVSLVFDISNRQLTVFHEGSYEPVYQRLESLNFDTTLQETIEIQSPIEVENQNQQRTILWQVLIINAFFFVLEIITGFIANSMGLVADSLDMLADSLVYGLALFAVGGSIVRKKNIAKVSGYFQMTLAVLGVVEVIRRFIGSEPVPTFGIMIIISVLALIGNATCLYLLQRSKSKEAHMQASMIFTSNDVIVNFGVIVAGVFVFITDTKYPDLIIGSIVFVLVLIGALKILRLSK